MNKKRLKHILSSLKDFEKPSLKLEQYSTPGDIAADMLWNAFMLGDVKDRIILDPACGPGVFGIGALLLGAEFVYFLDISEESIAQLKENLKMIKSEFDINDKYEIIKSDIADYKGKVDVVIQNPPFGTKQKHADKVFLEVAFRNADVIYSLHKLTSTRFVKAVAADHDFEITNLWEYDFALKATLPFHKRRVHRIKVGCWRLTKVL